MRLCHVGIGHRDTHCSKVLGPTKILLIFSLFLEILIFIHFKSLVSQVIL